MLFIAQAKRQENKNTKTKEWVRPDPLLLSLRLLNHNFNYALVVHNFTTIYDINSLLGLLHTATHEIVNCQL